MSEREGRKGEQSGEWPRVRWLGKHAKSSRIQVKQFKRCFTIYHCFVCENPLLKAELSSKL
jgi:hypothetical protein